MKINNKIEIILAVLILLVVGAYIYVSKNKTSHVVEPVGTAETNVLEKIASSPTPALKSASIKATVSSNGQIAQGTVNVGGVRLILNNGAFEIPTLAPGIYEISYDDQNGQAHTLNPSTLQIFPGENSNLSFTTTN